MRLGALSFIGKSQRGGNNECVAQVLLLLSLALGAEEGKQIQKARIGRVGCKARTVGSVPGPGTLRWEEHEFDAKIQSQRAKRGEGEEDDGKEPRGTKVYGLGQGQLPGKGACGQA